MIEFYFFVFVAALAVFAFVIKRLAKTAPGKIVSHQPSESETFVASQKYSTQTSDDVTLIKNMPESIVYLLSTHPSSYYLDQFDEKNIRIIPHRVAGHYAFRGSEYVKVDKEDQHSCYDPERPEEGVISIQTDFGEFQIYFPSNNANIDPKLTSIARYVLCNIVEMDTGPLSTSSSGHDKGFLGYVKIDYEEVELHYFSDIINTEWEKIFTKDNHGNWKELGAA